MSGFSIFVLEVEFSLFAIGQEDGFGACAVLATTATATAATAATTTAIAFGRAVGVRGGGRCSDACFSCLGVCSQRGFGGFGYGDRCGRNRRGSRSSGIRDGSHTSGQVNSH